MGHFNVRAILYWVYNCSANKKIFSDSMSEEIITLSQHWLKVNIREHKQSGIFFPPDSKSSMISQQII